MFDLESFVLVIDKNKYLEVGIGSYKKKKKNSNVWLNEKRVNYTNLPQGFKE